MRSDRVTINIGLTGWGDHPDIHEQDVGSRHKLASYAAYFPVVELDSCFYSIMTPEKIRHWDLQTPSNFSFVVKAYQAFTGHDRQPYTRKEIKAMFHSFQQQIDPLIESGKLNAILFQFPPWFDLRQSHIKRLRFIREQFQSYPTAIEFRNRTWFHEQIKADTINYLKEDKWIHTICDEPQAGQASVPVVPEITHGKQSLIRFHGRNVYGWNQSGQDNWREVRFLYNYNDDELKSWRDRVQNLSQQVEQLTILFNNNSGHHAYANAKRFQHLLGINYTGLNSRQIDLFSDQ